jgi:negative regulator of genetic competence, sporulation and motility
MSYHDLSECTLTATERLEEASRIIEMLSSLMDECSEKERRFIEGLESSCSVKQLFWLRDIKDRIL